MKVVLNIPDDLYEQVIKIAEKEYRTPELQILYFIDKGMHLSELDCAYPPLINTPLITFPTPENPEEKYTVTCGCSNNCCSHDHHSHNKKTNKNK